MDNSINFELIAAAIVFVVLEILVAYWFMPAMTRQQWRFYFRRRDIGNPTQERERRTARLWAFVVLSILVFDTVVVGAVYSRTLFDRDAGLAPTASVRAPALERLMQAGLADLAALKKTQADILDTLKRGGGPTPPTPAAASNGGGSISLTWPGVAAFALLMVGVFFLFRSSSSGPIFSASRILGVTSLLTGLTVMKADNFVKIDKVSFEFPITIPADPHARTPVDSLVVINVTPGSDNPIPIAAGNNVEIKCGSDQDPMRVGTFVSGKHQLLMSSAADTVEKLVERIESLAANKLLVGIFLMGSTDDEEMNVETKTRYGSNLTLAQKRAAWVSSEMKTLAAKRDDKRVADLSAMFVLGAAPNHVGAAVDKAATRAKDRIVSVCIILQQPPPVGPKAEK